jgi:transcriptional regulator with XRE-family HTH domain
MSRSIPALVKPALLIWARERAGLPLEEAASRLGIEVERLQQWEQGTDRPSIAQLRKIGELYKRPLAVFFLSEPPQGFDPQREFRRLQGVTPQTESPELRLAAAGHQTSTMEGRRLPEDQVLERVSNRFAAAALMPRQQFLMEASSHSAALAGDEQGLKRFANRIKVSPEAILRRLMALQKVPASLYRQKRRAWQQRSWFTFRQGDGGPPIEVRVVSSVGRAFASLVLEGYQRNAVSSADVVDYLGVQLKHLNKIAGHLLPEPGFAALA